MCTKLKRKNENNNILVSWLLMFQTKKLEKSTKKASSSINNPGKRTRFSSTKCYLDKETSEDVFFAKTHLDAPNSYTRTLA